MTMTQEEKQLLLKDLSARLPYGVMVQLLTQEIKPQRLECIADDYSVSFTNDVFGLIYLDNIKPYLRPMSSMTEEEMGNLEKYLGKKYDFRFTERESFIYIDWLNKHHFDYRGLIEMGLAATAPKGMYND